MNFFCVKLIFDFFYSVSPNAVDTFSSNTTPPPAPVRMGVIQVWLAKRQLGGPILHRVPWRRTENKLGTHFLTSWKCWMSGSLDKELKSLSSFSYWEHLCAECNSGVISVFSSFVGHTRFNAYCVLLLPSIAFALSCAAMIRILAGSSCGQWSLEHLSGASLFVTK